MIRVGDYKINNKGNRLVTKELQNLFDLAENDTIVISKGTYLVSSLFLKSGTTLILEEGAILLATTDESQYPLIETRIAGIDTTWYPAVLNVIDANNVTIIGEGKIDGNGPYWWNKYWGEDTKGGMRKEYDAKGLRFACDYDCKRVRNLLISSSCKVKIKGITSYHSGFWNVHVLYSRDIVIDGIRIDSNNNSPSTDGIDVDSSFNVYVQNCEINCNDDAIAIKSGRDNDGILKNMPCYNVFIRNNHIYNGFGITLGSEVSGGIHDIEITDNEFYGSDVAFRIKSSIARKGYIRNIKVSNLKCINVKYLFHLFTNWNPKYSICKLPKGYKGPISPLWEKLLSPTDPNIPNTILCDIEVSNIFATYDEDYKGISRVFNIVGFEDSKFTNITFSNMDIKAKEYGIIENAEVCFENCNIETSEEHNPENDEYDNR
jgi:polygalacturonase